MTTEYTKDDDMQTLRLWYDAKPFTEELENSIRDIPNIVFSDDVKDCYIKERLKKNDGEYDNPKEEPKDDDTKVDDTKVEETKESVQDEKAEIQEVGEAIEADACYWDGWNP